MRTIALRLRPGADLKAELLALAARKGVLSSWVPTCAVGGGLGVLPGLGLAAPGRGRRHVCIDAGASPLEPEGRWVPVTLEPAGWDLDGRRQAVARLIATPLGWPAA
jgi:hypothetical protein